jgi:hypothetical protein
MKLLLILNESKKGSHDDIYSALNELKLSEKIIAYQVIPFLELLANGRSQSEVFNTIVEESIRFEPHFILWSHTASLKFSQADFIRLKQSLPNTIMGYWDGDIYQTPYKRLPKNVIQLCQQCNVVFCQGFGAMTNKLKDNGCNDIRFVPASTSTHRFKGFDNSRKIEYDVVMIGNKIIRKNPLLTMPGTKLRTKLVKQFYKEFGDRFAVYGHGWKGPFAKGVLPFSDQAKAYQKARVVLGNNNLHAQYYFSNRLPIALSSGVPVMYNLEQDVDSLFPNNSPIWFSDPDDAIQKAKMLLAKSQTELDELGKNGRSWVLNNMATTSIFSYMVEVMKSIANKDSEKVKSPWLKKDVV